MKTTIVKDSLSLVEKSVFGRNKSKKANVGHNRIRSASGIYNQSLNLYMHQINDEDDLKRKLKGKKQRLQKIYDEHLI